MDKGQDEAAAEVSKQLEKEEKEKFEGCEEKITLGAHILGGSFSIPQFPSPNIVKSKTRIQIGTVICLESILILRILARAILSVLSLK